MRHDRGVTALKELPVVVDSRLRLPPGLSRSFVAALKRICTHANPDFHKKRAMGMSTYGVEGTIATWVVHDKGTSAESYSLPRGVLHKLRPVAKEVGYFVRVLDRRANHVARGWPELAITPRWYQDEAVDACMRFEQGIVRAPTGSGKTLGALTLASVVAQPTLVIMRDSNLLKQWVEVAVEKAGFHRKEIGILKGGKRLLIGERLTLALQQTLWSKSFPLDSVSKTFGLVMVDEVHTVAAATFQKVIDVFESRYRIGWSADETRKDKKEFLVYDQFGRTIYEIERDVLEEEGTITPVDIICVPTEFSAPWYSFAAPGERDWNGLLDDLTTDDDRNSIVVALTKRLGEMGELPALIFSHRVEHARTIADVALFAAGIRSGLLLGQEENAVRFAEDKAKLKAGDLEVCAGTFQAVGQGIDMPAVRSGILATPIGANRQFFNQVRGRVCRPSPGKERGTLYVLWDREIYPNLPRTLENWNGGTVDVRTVEEL